VAFNLKNFARFTWRSLFNSKGTDYRLTPRRIGRLVAFYLLFPLLELVIWFGFLLDDVFFRGYRRMEIEQPVFIVGNPRSGTTFLQRLLARDRENFTSMQLWEILLAPSVTYRKVVQALVSLDRLLGGPLQRRMAAQERRWKEENVMHRVALRAPEEDQYLLVHIWSTLAVWTFSGILEEAEPYTFFDDQVPQAEKERIMGFYRRCIQRYLYARAGGRGRAVHYLSKNPSASPKIDALYEFFPDAKIVYLARNPLDVIPSYVSLLDYTWRFFGDPLRDYGSRDYVLDMARHWYTYPLERLERAPEDSYAVVNFDDLVDDAEQTVADIYRRFGFEIGPAFAQVLREEAERARNHRSEHDYSLEQVGLTREQIVARYADVFDRFGFDTREGAIETGTRVEKQPGRAGRRAGRWAKARSRRAPRFGRRDWGRGET